MNAEGQPFNNPDEPGRLDINGVEWWACDPYPTWYRWENGALFTRPARWAECPECHGKGWVPGEIPGTRVPCLNESAHGKPRA